MKFDKFTAFLPKYQDLWLCCLNVDRIANKLSQTCQGDVREMSGGVTGSRNSHGGSRNSRGKVTGHVTEMSGKCQGVSGSPISSNSGNSGRQRRDIAGHVRKRHNSLICTGLQVSRLHLHKCDKSGTILFGVAVIQHLPVGQQCNQDGFGLHKKNAPSDECGECTWTSNCKRKEA